MDIWIDDVFMTTTCGPSRLADSEQSCTSLCEMPRSDVYRRIR